MYEEISFEIKKTIFFCSSFDIFHTILVYLFDLWFYIPVNNYGHVETVS